MFTKATFFAALVAGATAVSPAAYGEQPKGYGGERYNTTSTTPYAPEEPKTYPAETYPSTSSTVYSPEEPKTYPAEYPSSKTTPYSPSEPTTYPAEHSSTSKTTPHSPEQPSTYSSSSTTCTESTSTEEHPYKPTGAYPSKFTKTSDDYTTATITGTKYITVTAPHGTYVTTTESVYTTYCPKSDVSKYTSIESKTTPYSPEQPTKSVPAYPQKSESKSVPYSPEQPKTYPGHGPLTTGVYSKKPVPSGYTTSEAVYDKTLTYTLGHGASTTVITTTVKSTSTILLTKTVYASKPTGEATKPTGAATTPAGKGYKTYKGTSTVTNYVTVYPKPTGNTENSPVPTGNTENSPVPNGNKPEYECKPQTVTVTEKETVYVTAPAATSYKSEAPKKPSSAPYYPTKSAGYPVSSGVAKSTGFATYYTKPSAPVYKPTESKSTPYSPQQPSKSAPVYPVKSSSTEHSPEKPTYPASYPAESKPTYPATSYPVESKTTQYEYKPTTTSTKDTVSTAYVTPYPEKSEAPKAPVYGSEKPAGY
ncbi:hypothetical protein Slin15195_G119310 [Septoria linicola]|uniref:Uncharacterized protein n=1 Tax=Septoria linicola TaxID=215465 RepID=A0A9Q9AZ07_9PEZI|nr:hypothetical protein Slin14017_G096300 [Septoria linicola]USW58612.1 hypothetical protein Slin15195_G119310 [Septoria linicola]